MPKRALAICGAKGCANAMPCPVHTPKPWAGSTRKARLPKDWARRRRFVMRRDDHVCQVCHDALATEVDHITPGDNHKVDNLQAICHPCHVAKTATEVQASKR